MAEQDDDVGAIFDQQNIKRIYEEQQRMEAKFKESGWQLFSRSPPKINSSKPLQFMQLECDYYTQGQQSVIRMFGVTAEGNSILCHVYNFLSFFYMQAPVELLLEPQHIQQFQKEFNILLAKQKNFGGKEPILKIEVCQKESIRYYKGDNKKINYLKIYVVQPVFVAQIRNFLKSDNRMVCDMELPQLTFESNIPYALRFMIEYDIVGMGWIELKNYVIRDDQNKISSCQIEINVDCQHVKSIPLDEISDIAPLRILSFDIECAAEKGFPNEEHDPIIQISCIVKVHNRSEELIRVVFTLGDCEKIPGAWVKSFQKEEDLLNEFQVFFSGLDPDIIIGYNIQNFDIPYILNRAHNLRLKNYGIFGRIPTTQSVIKNGKFLSKAMGMRETKDINIEGRIQLDMMIHMMKEHKLSSFSLNNVSFQFLKQQKEDVHYSIIYTLQNKSPETRKRIAVYCLKDAELPILLMDKLCCLYNYTEMARVTGVPINYLFMRGQQIKVASQLLRKAKHYDFIIPTEHFKSTDQEYQGAFVLDPVKNFYKVPIATLDFASLYPSIMMAHNMCYSTLLNTSPNRVGLEEEQVTISPETNAIFVKPNIRKGMLPLILEDLINARKKAKNQLAQETDPFKKAVLDGRQLALKISANSVYGFTGAQVGQLPCLEISASITSFGRQMIQFTRDTVLEHYSKKNGAQFDAEVIYGDTDSVMVKFGDYSVEQAMALGREAAALISKKFIQPIKLEFEKVYYPYLLMNRKRYAGQLWTKPDKPDKIDTKGIESVRRDNCFLIRKMVTEILYFLLIKQDEKSAVQYTKEQIRNLYLNKVDISELVITKSLNSKKEDKDGGKDKDKKKNQNEDDGNKLTKNYKQKQAHVVVAEKMQNRDASNAPSAGDRIAYIIIQGAKGSKTYENAEDPVEVLEKDFPIDFDYYVNNQIKKPIMRLFEFVIPNPESIFVGDHTMSRYIPKVNINSALGKFVQKRTACLNCKKVIKENEALCNFCHDKTLEIMTKSSIKLQELQINYHKYWTTCQSCQGSLLGDILCSNRDCEIYYKRIKVQRDLKEQWDEIDKLYAQQQ
ncbi:unnamed protein product [Paramecium primaurelia]|uniref:DNA polymerase n=1 Tax=Paramecium primaurelia TaxID=5886 RepID=A0A8S1L9V5_PARPR|nr:unnamed protein product [Paramecium primaurelia]